MMSKQTDLLPLHAKAAGPLRHGAGASLTLSCGTAFLGTGMGGWQPGPTTLQCPPPALQRVLERWQPDDPGLAAAAHSVRSVEAAFRLLAATPAAEVERMQVRSSWEVQDGAEQESPSVPLAGTFDHVHYFLCGGA